MKALKQIAGALAVIALTTGQGVAENYYGGGNAIPLKVDSNRVTIKFDDQTALIDHLFITFQPLADCP